MSADRGQWGFATRVVAMSAVCFLVTVVLTIRGAAAPADQAARARSSPADTYQNVYSGWKWWHVYCYRCHGVDAIGTSTAPNLTDPNEKFSAPEFLKIVKFGIPDKGMQAWNKLLDDKQIGQIYVYVRARTEKVLPPGRPDEVGPNGGAWVPPPKWAAK